MDRILSIALFLAIGILVLSAVLMIYLPKPGEKFSEFYILGENRTADSYPQFIILGTPHLIYVGIGNHEYRTVNYSVEIYLVSNPLNETTSAPPLPSTLLLKTHSITLNHNETTVTPFEFKVPNTSYNRLDFLLFNETLPDQDITAPNRLNASYRNLHLWLNVISSSPLKNATVIGTP